MWRGEKDNGRNSLDDRGVGWVILALYECLIIGVEQLDISCVFLR
jgi:hypothetical protein